MKAPGEMDTKGQRAAATQRREIRQAWPCQTPSTNPVDLPIQDHDPIRLVSAMLIPGGAMGSELLWTIAMQSLCSARRKTRPAARARRWRRPTPPTTGTPADASEKREDAQWSTGVSSYSTRSRSATERTRSRSASRLAVALAKASAGSWATVAGPGAFDAEAVDVGKESVCTASTSQWGSIGLALSRVCQRHRPQRSCADERRTE